LGQTPWNKGKETSEETKQKQSLAKLGKGKPWSEKQRKAHEDKYLVPILFSFNINEEKE